MIRSCNLQVCAIINCAVNACVSERGRVWKNQQTGGHHLKLKWFNGPLLGRRGTAFRHRTIYSIEQLLTGLMFGLDVRPDDGPFANDWYYLSSDATTTTKRQQQHLVALSCFCANIRVHMDPVAKQAETTFTFTAKYRVLFSAAWGSC